LFPLLPSPFTINAPPELQATSSLNVCAARIEALYPHLPISITSIYPLGLDLALIFRRRLCDFSWRLKRLLYFSVWPIGIDIDMSSLHIYSLFGLLNLLQPTHRRLLELPIRNHRIARHGPDLVLESIYTILILRRRRHSPSWLYPSLSNLRTRSDSPAP
jgi:hypothetical protein